MSILLLSGGIDSTVLAHTYPDISKAIFFDYGQQNCREEFFAATEALKTTKITEPLTVIKIPPLPIQNASTNLWLGRNSLFILYALEHVDQDGKILIGCNQDDWDDYSDCRPSWLSAINTLISTYGKARVVAPFLYKKKQEVIWLGDKAGVDWGKTVTCYHGTNCGECASCKTREIAFGASKSALQVNDIWDTIQGEGPDVGRPATFIRLQGCNVGCSWCDTKDSWDASKGNSMMISEILDREFQELVVITGGEPAQADKVGLQTLVCGLIGKGKEMAIETSGNGKALDDIGGECKIILSPKKDVEVSSKVKNMASAVKFVVVDEEDLERCLKFCMGMDVDVYLQPVWGDKKATKICVEACMKMGYRMSIQAHKYLGVK